MDKLCIFSTNPIDSEEQSVKTSTSSSRSAKGSALHDKEQPSSSADTHWEKIPSKRQLCSSFYIRKIPSFAVVLLTLSAIFVYGFQNKETTYIACNITTNFNETIKSCWQKEITTYPILFYFALGLLSILFGVVVDRLFLAIEELRHLKTKYNGMFRNLFKLCFSGISWGSVAVLSSIFAMSLYIGRRTPLRPDYALLILGGIGVCPLLIRIFIVYRQPDIVVSKILETEKMYPGYTLAWYYYFNTLTKKLNDFNQLLQLPTTIELSLKRMILLLIPAADIGSIEELTSIDSCISKISSEGKDLPSIYQLKLDPDKHESKYFVMSCVREPIVALRNMKSLRNVSFVNDTTYEDELKRFYNTLCEILEDAPDDKFSKKVLLVPVTVTIGQYDKLQNGGLVEIIMKAVNNDGRPWYQDRKKRNIQKKEEVLLAEN